MRLEKVNLVMQGCVKNVVGAEVMVRRVGDWEIIVVRDNRSFSQIR